MITFKINQNDVKEALLDHVGKKYGTHFNPSKVKDGVFIEWREREYTYLRHKNGKLKKDEDGHSQIDWENSPYKTKTAGTEWEYTLSLYLEEDHL
jgi:hypothetical protein